MELEAAQTLSLASTTADVQLVGETAVGLTATNSDVTIESQGTGKVNIEGASGVVVDSSSADVSISARTDVTATAASGPSDPAATGVDINAGGTYTDSGGDPVPAISETACERRRHMERHCRRRQPDSRVRHRGPRGSTAVTLTATDTVDVAATASAWTPSMSSGPAAWNLPLPAMNASGEMALPLPPPPKGMHHSLGHVDCAAGRLH